MGDDRNGKSSPQLQEFNQRLRKVQQARNKREGGKQTGQKGAALGFGFRIAIDLVCAVAVAFGLGWFLDWWLGTKPWLLLILVPFGIAAGILNVMRAAKAEEERRQAEEQNISPSDLTD